MICADTAAYLLIHHSIYPDLIISIDSGRGTLYHFRSEIPVHIPILTWFGGNSFLFDLDNPLIIYLSNYPLDQVLASYLNDSNIQVLSNPSLNVAGLSKSLCIHLKASRLLVSGLSLTRIDGKSHCRGTGYENYLLDKIKRTYSIENYRPITYKETLSTKNKIAHDYIYQTESNFKVEKFADTFLQDQITRLHTPFSKYTFSLKHFLDVLEHPFYQSEILKHLSMNYSVYKRNLIMIKNL